ncbi:MAG: hypothetical protein DMG07_29035 [Acidobacteria bacterium]|nr:MAG: hypothetical protein DMG07_29035 [Acidobacteriota bacterium]
MVEQEFLAHQQARAKIAVILGLSARVAVTLVLQSIKEIAAGDGESTTARGATLRSDRSGKAERGPASPTSRTQTPCGNYVM